MTKKLTFLVAMGLIVMPISANATINMSVNGSLNNEITPQIIQDKVYLPLKDVSDLLKFEINWDNIKKEATIKNKDITSVIRMGEKTADMNGNSVEMDAAMIVVNGKTMLPIRATGNLMGLDIEWENDSKTVYIYSDLVEMGIVPVNPKNKTVSLAQRFDNIYLLEGVESQKVKVTTEGALKIEVDVPNINHDIVDEKLISESVKEVHIERRENKLVIELNVSEEYKSYIKDLENGVAFILHKKPALSSVEEIEEVIQEQVLPIEQKGKFKYEIRNEHPVITITKAKEYDPSKIIINDDYLNHNIVIDLGKDYSNIFDKAYIKVADNYLNTVSLNTTNGTTKISISEKAIYGVKVIENGDSIEFHILRPRQVYDKVVVLDIGHGGQDAGAVGNGIQEKKINFNQAVAVEKLLAEQGIKAYLTRNTDKYIVLKDRSAFSNQINPHLFISFHNNSASSPVAKGTEVLFNPNSSLSKKAAQDILGAIISNTGMYNRGIKARTDLSVLRHTESPAVLLEVGFISNASDAAKLKSNTFTEQVAKGIVEGIKKYLG